MPDIIQLLPDSIANQIAAGEVIQRPASAVKELLENAVDAGATEIQLIISDAGKSLIQVIDNGKGMSETDARMCFERHATSKISSIDDLFRIRTMGFRGEALASIAAVAQVELKTRKGEQELGTYIEIEDSRVKTQEPAAITKGTSISMKNVFFNVPARRNFLKSNAAEMRHIVDEFTRVALSFPEIFFSLISNGQELFHLEKGTLKQRIIQLLGNQYSAKLVTVQENTDYMNIYGFAGKPETSRKTRGDQYFFVNNRFIKSPYLHHAVMGAYEEMIAKDSFPLYVLFIDLEPSQIDINVHPTKQEIKFEDEKIVYAFVQAAVKHALAQFSITPTLDFNLDPEIQKLEAVSKPFTQEKRALAAGTSLYKTFTQSHQAHVIEPGQKSELRHWKDFFEREKEQEPVAGDENIFSKEQSKQESFNAVSSPLTLNENAAYIQFLNTYILCETNRGFILLNQQAAHERILYERYTDATHGNPIPVQKSLFPSALQLATADAALVVDLLPELKLLGYQLEPFGKDTFVIEGTPADVEQGNEARAIEKMLEQFKHFSSDIKFSKREKLVRTLAEQHAVRTGRKLSKDEMKMLAEDLFNSKQPNITPAGKPTYLEFKKDQLEKMFSK